MKGTCKKMKWIERNMMKHEQNQKNITGNCMETHTDKRKVKGTMKGMKTKRKGKTNASKMTANERNVKRTWTRVICMGNGTTCSESEGLLTYDDHTRVMSPRPLCHFVMKIVTGNEKRVTRVRIMCPHIQILNSWPKHANLCVGAFTAGFAG